MLLLLLSGRTVSGQQYGGAGNNFRLGPDRQVEKRCIVAVVPRPLRHADTARARTCTTLVIIAILLLAAAAAILVQPQYPNKVQYELVRMMVRDPVQREPELAQDFRLGRYQRVGPVSV